MSKLDICPDCVAEIEAEDITIFGDVIDALKVVIATADPREVTALRKTVDAFARQFPDDYYWATGYQAPSMLNDLIHHIEIAVDDATAATAQAEVARVLAAVAKMKRAATRTGGEKHAD